MDTADEVIALLLEGSGGPLTAEPMDLASTTCLVRDAAGNMRLEKPDSQAELERTAETTGVFKRGTPIVDPGSGDVIGYEMEEIEVFGAVTR